MRYTGRWLDGREPDEPGPWIRLKDYPMPPLKVYYCKVCGKRCRAKFIWPREYGISFSVNLCANQCHRELIGDKRYR